MLWLFKKAASKEDIDKQKKYEEEEYDSEEIDLKPFINLFAQQQLNSNIIVDENMKNDLI